MHIALTPHITLTTKNGCKIILADNQAPAPSLVVSEWCDQIKQTRPSAEVVVIGGYADDPTVKTLLAAMPESCRCWLLQLADLVPKTLSGSLDGGPMLSSGSTVIAMYGSFGCFVAAMFITGEGSNLFRIDALRLLDCWAHGYKAEPTHPIWQLFRQLFEAEGRLTSKNKRQVVAVFKRIMECHDMLASAEADVKALLGEPEAVSQSAERGKWLVLSF